MEALSLIRYVFVIRVAALLSQSSVTSCLSNPAHQVILFQTIYFTLASTMDAFKGKFTRTSADQYEEFLKVPD